MRTRILSLFIIFIALTSVGCSRNEQSDVQKPSSAAPEQTEAKGRYFNVDDATEWILLNQDGTFQSFENGTRYQGTYEIDLDERGEEITFAGRPGRVPSSQFWEDHILDLDESGKQWIKKQASRSTE